ncbi:MAG: nucleoside hydrolase [Chloroflexota bacterium]
MRKMIIDTDTASDDAVAILMAHRWPDIQVEAVTIVSGNVHVEQASLNARYTIELCGKQTPVHTGCTRPLLREPIYAYWFHGPDGMGGMNYPAPKTANATNHGVDMLIETIKANAGEIILVTLGPLTNVATALLRAPEIATMVTRCVVMGGAAVTIGNVTPAAEYNIWVDPEAARIVFRSGLPIEMVGWELCRGAANLTTDEIASVYTFNTPLAKFAMDCNVHALRSSQEWLGDPGLGLPDPVAMAVALDPGVVKRQGKYRVDVETTGELTRGMTVIDELNVVGTQSGFTEAWQVRDPNVTICWELDAPRWKEILYTCLR